MLICMAHSLTLDSACMAIVGEDDIACVAVSSAEACTWCSTH